MTVESPTVLKSGIILGNRYQLQTNISSGRMGEVWKAVDNKTRHYVIVKFIPDTVKSYQTTLTDFIDGCVLTLNLSHPNICKTLDLNTDALYGTYGVFEWLVGESLKSYNAKHEPLPKTQVRYILSEVAKGLDYLHKHNVIHRDIKPSNIFINVQGGKIKSVKIIDFGVSNMIKDTGIIPVREFCNSGTRPFMPPEQWSGKQQNAQTDQYALAITAYQLLSGRLPFRNKDKEVLRSLVMTKTPGRITDISTDSNNALQKALSKKAVDRFPTCSAFVQSLNL